MVESVQYQYNNSMLKILYFCNYFYLENEECQMQLTFPLISFAVVFPWKLQKFLEAVMHKTRPDFLLIV